MLRVCSRQKIHILACVIQVILGVEKVLVQTPAGAPGADAGAAAAAAATPLAATLAAAAASTEVIHMFGPYNGVPPMYPGTPRTLSAIVVPPFQVGLLISSSD